MGRKHLKEAERVYSDLGTPEVSRHHIVAPEPTYSGHLRARVVDQCEIDAMLLADLITLDEHNVLERVFESARRARGASVIGCYDPRVSRNRDPQAVSEGRSEALRVYIGLQRAVIRDAGETGLVALIRLVVDDVRPKKIGPLRKAIRAADLFFLSQ